MSINFYAYTYPAHIAQITNRKGLWVKFGDTTREPSVRMNEQGGASEAETKTIIGTWKNISTISRDYEVHRVLRDRGCQNKKEFTGKGTEWFRIPVTTIKEANTYVSTLLDDIGGKGSSLRTVTLRDKQDETIEQAMEMIEKAVENGQDVTNIIANLCPRFGKTIWALTLFNRINKKYGNRIMLLPAYWLSVHGSFSDEIESFREFSNMEVITTKDEDAEEKVQNAFNENRQVVLEVSLHGDVAAWQEKHKWLSAIDNDEFFVFSDEADFGSHTTNQVEKLQSIFF